jgi:DNA-binding beta-propeller fold protein YncE
VRRDRVAIFLGLATAGFLAAGSAQPQDPGYLVLVASEAADTVSRLRFQAGTLTLLGTVPVGVMPNDIDGPHGLTVAPDGRSYFVTLAHGQPNGTLVQLALEDDRPLRRVPLGMFPATADVTPDGEFVYVVNFNLHGDPVPSSVSVVSTSGLLEVARIRTCVMPHGSRVNRQGTRHYSACMMDDTLVEIDTRALAVARHFRLTRGREAGHAGAPAASAASLTHDGAPHPGPSAAGPGACSPTWAEPSPDGRRVFAACNASNDIVEIDVSGWSLVRRLPSGEGVYNLAATHDGRLLVATNRRGASVSIIDAAAGREVARLPTRGRVVHGVAISSDDRYAFISEEGVGAEPGIVEVVDLSALRVIASAEVPPQAGGIGVVVGR